MPRRNPTNTVTENILSAIRRDGADMATIAAATDMGVMDLTRSLNEGTLTAPQTVRVGGFLRLTATDLFHGAAA